MCVLSLPPGKTMLWRCERIINDFPRAFLAFLLQGMRFSRAETQFNCQASTLQVQ
jgi:hypothetical protein